ncbi:hypothetical protein ES332_D05G343300v1 [Gossypium tomentosum]|uniref:GOLD domain-containing protein n=1 Tax=Gossypium tomentosum TaxID=34277 RepID=A0A5D2L3D2_GOSTO|nr:hypothetical protein ES332_D05G343300v1 [Gossypium tomentosum]
MILRSVIMVVVVVVVGILSSASQALRFELQSGHTKCISEDIKSNSMTVGKYHVVNPNEAYPLPDSLKFAVRVTSPQGNSLHTAEKVETGQFAFTAAEDGDYMACFWAEDHSPQIIMTVDFDWRSGVQAMDWSNVAKKGQVDVMELELKKLYDTVTSIHEEMFYLREREEEMQALNQATTSKMFWLSFLSLFLCLSVAGIQFWHLKTFFEKKKLI